MSARPERRSPVDAWHEAHAAAWQRREAMRVPASYGATAPAGVKLQFRDVSWRRRLGCKGPAAEGWLASHGFTVPPGTNRWVVDGAGQLVARLATSEFLVEAVGDAAPGITTALAKLGENRPPGVYPVARHDLAIDLTGAALGELLLQVCSIDFAPRLRTCAADAGEVLLTSMAGVAVVAVVRADVLGPRLSLWCDPSYGLYFWSTLLEVAADLDGGVAACNAQGHNEEQP